MANFDLQEMEFANNPEPRVPCVLLLDVSFSMTGEPIAALNRGIRTFKNEVMEDDVASLRVEVAVVTFSSSAEVVQEFVTMDDFDPPTLTVSGSTQMSEGINQALDLIDRRKQDYRKNGIEYYRPWVLMITDGEPTESHNDVDRAARRVKQEDANRRVAFFCVGVRGANIPQLTAMMPDNRPPLMLDGLKFNELFQWLSASMSQVSSSRTDDAQISMPDISGWTTLQQ